MKNHNIYSFSVKILGLQLDNSHKNNSIFNFALFYNDQIKVEGNLNFDQLSIAAKPIVFELKQQEIDVNAQSYIILQCFEIVGKKNMKEFIGYSQISLNDFISKNPIVYNIQSENYDKCKIKVLLSTEFINNNIIQEEAIKEDEYATAYQSQSSAIQRNDKDQSHLFNQQITFNYASQQKYHNIESLMTLNHIIQQRNDQLQNEVHGLYIKLQFLQQHVIDLQNKLQHHTSIQSQNKALQKLIKQSERQRSELMKQNDQYKKQELRLNKQVQLLRGQNSKLIEKINAESMKLMHLQSKHQFTKHQSISNTHHHIHHSSNHQSSKTFSNISKPYQSHQQKYIIYKKEEKNLNFDEIMMQFARQTRHVNQNKYVLKNTQKKQRKMAQVQRQIYMMGQKKKRQSYKYVSLSTPKSSESAAIPKPNNI